MLLKGSLLGNYGLIWPKALCEIIQASALKPKYLPILCPRVLMVIITPPTLLYFLRPLHDVFEGAGKAVYPLEATKP